MGGDHVPGQEFRSFLTRIKSVAKMSPFEQAETSIFVSNEILREGRGAMMMAKKTLLAATARDSARRDSGHGGRLG
jgi:hypothetical protein